MEAIKRYIGSPRFDCPKQSVRDKFANSCMIISDKFVNLALRGINNKTYLSVGLFKLHSKGDIKYNVTSRYLF